MTPSSSSSSCPVCHPVNAIEGCPAFPQRDLSFSHVAPVSHFSNVSLPPERGMESGDAGTAATEERVCLNVSVCACVSSCDRIRASIRSLASNCSSSSRSSLFAVSVVVVVPSSRSRSRLCCPRRRFTFQHRHCTRCFPRLFGCRLDERHKRLHYCTRAIDTHVDTVCAYSSSSLAVCCPPPAVLRAGCRSSVLLLIYGSRRFPIPFFSCFLLRFSLFPSLCSLLLLLLLGHIGQSESRCRSGRRDADAHTTSARTIASDTPAIIVFFHRFAAARRRRRLQQQTRTRRSPGAITSLSWRENHGLRES